MGAAEVFDFESGEPAPSDGPPAPIPAAELNRELVALAGGADDDDDSDDTDDDDLVDASENPAYANRAAALAESVDDDTEQPLLPPVPDTDVTLPGGLVVKGRLVCEAEVREMNGADEEALAKAVKNGNLTRFIDQLVQRCLVRIGHLEGEKLTTKVTDSLLIGDRDMLAMKIRTATFGDVLRLDVRCPSCRHEFKVDYNFRDDVPVRKLTDCEDIEDPLEREFTRSLPSGKTAVVKLIDGAAQKAVYTADNSEKTGPELDTLMLRECVRSIDGRPVTTMAAVRDYLTAADRRAVIRFIANNQPGPRYEEVVQECPQCQHEFPLVLDVLTMFRGE